MNLINDPWIPVKTQSGKQKIIRPADITDCFQTDPVISFDLPRADFQAAQVQFMLGLLYTCCMPKTDTDWATWMRDSGVPSPEVLHSEFKKVDFAFNLDGDGPRFMQDFDLDTTKLEPKSIGSLLIDEPGEQTLKFNKDLFIKRNQFTQLSLPMAAMALFSLQLNAPAGGAGHRTSLRGGGPLTTLVIPKAQKNRPQTLWELLWANVLSEEHFEDGISNWKKQPEIVFPWLTKTISSATEKIVSPKGNNPLLMFWATPRRIRLGFKTMEKGVCGISGEKEECIKSYFTQNYGANYTGWQHVLSPHYKKGSDTLPLHPNAGGMSYKHWLGWIFGDKEGKTQTIQSKNIRVSQESLHRKPLSKKGILWAFGFDMDNMKARGWQESKIPLIVFEHSEFEKDNQENLAFQIKKGVSAAEECIFTLRKQIRLAQSTESTPEGIDKEFWNSTEASFRKFLITLQGVFDKPERVNPEIPITELIEAQEEWSKILLNSVLALYDKWTSSGQMEFENIEKIIKSRKGLHSKKFKSKVRSLIGLVEVPNE